MSELIIQQFVRTRQVLKVTLADVSPEAFEVIPQGVSNNLHWQLGHILVTAELFLFHGQQNLPAEYNGFFGNSTSPKEWTDGVPSVETVLQQLDEQAVRIQELDVTKFAENLPQPFIGNNTYGELAAMGAFHESLHLGQIQIIKRIV